MATMAATVFTGCGKNDDKTKDTSKENTPTESKNPDQEEKDDQAKAKGSVYYLNFKPEQKEQWEDVAKKYTKATGVKVNVVTAASGTYEPTLKAQIDKADAPTLFQCDGPKGLARWKDYCYDMKDSDIYKNVKSDDFVLKGENGEVYGIAYVIETYGIIYNKAILNDYFAKDYAVVKSVDEINSFARLKEVAESIQANKDDLGVMGAFTSAGMDSSSDWRFKTHLANLPIYYEYLERGIGDTEAIEGRYLDNYKQVWDLYLNNSTCKPTLVSSKTIQDATSEFALGDAVFYQNGTWAYADIQGNEVSDDNLGMLPIYIGAEGEENQGLCTGSENYWCINKNASQEDIDATLEFVNWVTTSDEGRTAVAKDMGFVTPFKSFTQEYAANNPLIKIADEYIAKGKTAVSWNFPTIPSDEWKTGVGSALLEYAQGTGDWDGVKKAFVDGWATEVAAAKENQ